MASNNGDTGEGASDKLLDGVDTSHGLMRIRATHNPTPDEGERFDINGVLAQVTNVDDGEATLMTTDGRRLDIPANILLDGFTSVPHPEVGEWWDVDGVHAQVESVDDGEATLMTTDGRELGIPLDVLREHFTPVPAPE